MARFLFTELHAPVLRVAVAACLGLIVCRAGQADDLAREKAEAKIAIDELTSQINEATEPDPDLYEERGDALMLLGNSNQAFEDYSKAIAITAPSRSSFFLFAKRVWAAVGKGDYSQALADAQLLTTKSVSLKAESHATLALILARSPDPKVKNAKASLDAALLAAHLDKERRAVVLVEQALAAAYSANGDFEKAVIHQEKSLGAVKGRVPSEWKAQLEAYKTGKEYPFQKSKPQ